MVEDSIVRRPQSSNALIGDFRPEVVIHTAASYKDPDDWQADALTNCVGSANIARACKDHKVGRLIYFQTALCYGTKPREQPITLSHPIDPVNSSYAISKTAGEHYIQLQRRRLGDIPARQCCRTAQRQRATADLFRTSVARKALLCHRGAARFRVCRGPRPHRVAGRLTASAAAPITFHRDATSRSEELYDSVVRAMQLNDYPGAGSPAARRRRGADDPARPEPHLPRFRRDANSPRSTRSSPRRWHIIREHGVQGGYTHLRAGQSS